MAIRPAGRFDRSTCFLAIGTWKRDRKPKSNGVTPETITGLRSIASTDRWPSGAGGLSGRGGGAWLPVLKAKNICLPDRVGVHYRVMTTDDMALVREFAAGDSERAFETLVSRNVHL